MVLLLLGIYISKENIPWIRSDVWLETPTEQRHQANTEFSRTRLEMNDSQLKEFV